MIRKLHVQKGVSIKDIKTLPSVPQSGVDFEPIGCIFERCLRSGRCQLYVQSYTTSISGFAPSVIGELDGPEATVASTETTPARLAPADAATAAVDCKKVDSIFCKTSVEDPVRFQSSYADVPANSNTQHNMPRGEVYRVSSWCHLKGKGRQWVSITIYKLPDGYCSFRDEGTTEVCTVTHLEEKLTTASFKEFWGRVRKAPPGIILVSNATGISWIHPLAAHYLLRQLFPAVDAAAYLIFGSHLCKVAALCSTPGMSADAAHPAVLAACDSQNNSDAAFSAAAPPPLLRPLPQVQVSSISSDHFLAVLAVASQLQKGLGLQDILDGMGAMQLCFPAAQSGILNLSGAMAAGVLAQHPSVRFQQGLARLADKVSNDPSSWPDDGLFSCAPAFESGSSTPPPTVHQDPSDPFIYAADPFSTPPALCMSNSIAAGLQRVHDISTSLAAANAAYKSKRRHQAKELQPLQQWRNQLAQLAESKQQAAQSVKQPALQLLGQPDVQQEEQQAVVKPGGLLELLLS